MYLLIEYENIKDKEREWGRVDKINFFYVENVLTWLLYVNHPTMCVFKIKWLSNFYTLSLHAAVSSIRTIVLIEKRSIQTAKKDIVKSHKLLFFKKSVAKMR